MRLIRSLLFAPANRHDLLKKLPRYPADAVAIDLEDATPENEKAAARDGLQDIVAFRRDAEVGRQLCYDGKMCVTPRQVEIANEVFFAFCR